MAKVTVSVEVSKEAHELAQGVCEMVLAVKAAMADGWQTGQDVPVLITAALTTLAPAITGVEQLGDELKEDPAAFASAIALPVGEMVSALLKKEDAPEPPAAA